MGRDESGFFSVLQGEKAYSCSQCGTRFTYRNGLIKHTKLNRCPKKPKTATATAATAANDIKGQREDEKAAKVKRNAFLLHSHRCFLPISQLSLRDVRRSSVLLQQQQLALQPQPQQQQQQQQRPALIQDELWATGDSDFSETSTIIKMETPPSPPPLLVESTLSFPPSYHDSLANVDPFDTLQCDFNGGRLPSFASIAQSLRMRHYSPDPFTVASAPFPSPTSNCSSSSSSSEDAVWSFPPPQQTSASLDENDLRSLRTLAEQVFGPTSVTTAATAMCGEPLLDAASSV